MRGRIGACVLTASVSTSTWLACGGTDDSAIAGSPSADGGGPIDGDVEDAEFEGTQNFIPDPKDGAAAGPPFCSARGNNDGFCYDFDDEPLKLQPTWTPDTDNAGTSYVGANKSLFVSPPRSGFFYLSVTQTIDASANMAGRATFMRSNANAPASSAKVELKVLVTNAYAGEADFKLFEVKLLNGSGNCAFGLKVVASGTGLDLFGETAGAPQTKSIAPALDATKFLPVRLEWTAGGSLTAYRDGTKAAEISLPSCPNATGHEVRMGPQIYLGGTPTAEGRIDDLAYTFTP